MCTWCEFAFYCSEECTVRSIRPRRVHLNSQLQSHMTTPISICTDRFWGQAADMNKHLPVCYNEHTDQLWSERDRSNEFEVVD